MNPRDVVRLGRAGLELARLHRQQWQDPERLRALQWRRLVSIVRYAEASSPFYRRRFREAGFASDDLRGWDDLPRVPITTREDLQSSEGLVADGFDLGELRSSHTSGSTGRPTTTRFDPWGWMVAKYVLKMRARAACGLRPWHRIAVLQEDVGPDDRSRLAGRRASFSVHSPAPELARELSDHAPDALYGPPSHLGKIVGTGTRIPSIRRLFTSAEMLDPHTRRKLEEGFGAPVLDIYGCTEAKEVAWQCAEREGYHVNAEWVVVESVGSDGLPAEGDGQILITSLYNRGMPLLRYRVGDTGRLLQGRCPCGRGLPLMIPVLGRIVDYVHLPGRPAVSPYTLTCAVEHVHGMRQYQIVQGSDGGVLVRIVPREHFGDRGVEAVRSALESALPGVEVHVEVVGEIASEPSGKFRIVRSDVGADAR